MFINFLTNILSHILFLFGYISNNSLFPEPLSKTEEEYYLKKYFEGDKDAKNKLIEHNLRLVAHISKRYANTEQELEDLLLILLENFLRRKKKKNFLNIYMKTI